MSATHNSCATEVNHPLVKHHLTRLRDSQTSPLEFRALVRRLSVLLAFEATRDLPLRERKVQTPLTETLGYEVEPRVGLVPILRAGLGMVDSVLDLIPHAEVWHLGLFRDEETAQPVEYYSKLPEKHAVDTAFILDPMLATGGSAVSACQTLMNWGVTKIKMLAIIAAPEGVAELSANFPDVEVVVCAVDEKLNDQKFIVPGLGDAGDRIFNTLQ